MLAHLFQRLNDNIELITALAPISYSNNTVGMLKLSTPFLNSLPHWLITTAFLPNNEMLHNITDKNCNAGNPTQTVCYALLFSITGFCKPKVIISFPKKLLSDFEQG